VKNNFTFISLTLSSCAEMQQISNQLTGVFKMISVEEKNIRTDLNSRTYDLLKKVFALQENK
jgi:hypothetical protein